MKLFDYVFDGDGNNKKTTDLKQNLEIYFNNKVDEIISGLNKKMENIEGW